MSLFLALLKNLTKNAIVLYKKTIDTLDTINDNISLSLLYHIDRTITTKNTKNTKTQKYKLNDRVKNTTPTKIMQHEPR